MTYIDWVEIENFKGLTDKVKIPLGNPSVVIGPNNAGKTTVLQALSLWSRAVRAWTEKKGSGHQKAKRDAVGINRMLIMDIPVKESRYFWNATKIRAKGKNIDFTIEVGVRMPDGHARPVKMVFSYRDPETLYSKPADDCMGNAYLLDVAAEIDFNLLYPMSGLTGGDNGRVEETRLMDGRINVLLGQGQTAQVLRNLCYKVFEQSPDRWSRIVEIMDRMFGFRLSEPHLDESRGSISLDYTQLGTSEALEISLVGRGAQQMLLILAYMFGRENGVLMIDEPDAHLEILRQKQVFIILRDVAEDTKTQVLIATHSEVILDEAVETNLTGIVNGTVLDLAAKKDVKTTLRALGIQHYYKAVVEKRLLVTEGSTDVDMLRAFAKKINHPAKDILDGRLFTFYTQDVSALDSTETRLDRTALSGVDFRQYFYTLKKLVPELKAVAIRDGDGKVHQASTQEGDLLVHYWDRYELENYFITPQRLADFAAKEIGRKDGELFAASSACQTNIDAAVDGILSEMVFGGDAKQVAEYKAATPALKATILKNVKMSDFAERFFERFAVLNDSPVLLNKGGYYRMIADLSPSDVSDEIKKVLDDISEVFAAEEGIQS